MDNKMLEGKVAIITEASYGMGQTMAELFAEEGALNTLTKNVAMRLIDTNIRCNAVASGATITPAHLASKIGRAVRGQVLQVCNGAFL